MNLQGIELISRHTTSANKIIWGLSGGLLVIVHYDFNSKVWSFFNRDVQPNEFREIATIIVLFSVASLVVHWISDYMAYTKWFQTNRLNTESIDAIGSFRHGTVPTKDGFMNRVNGLKKTYADYCSNLDKIINQLSENSDDLRRLKERAERLEDSVKKIQNFQAQIVRGNDDLAALLEDIGPGFKKVSYAGFFLIYIWYLALPLSIAMTALTYMWVNAGAV